jgi:hypothetical protein
VQLLRTVGSAPAHIPRRPSSRTTARAQWTGPGTSTACPGRGPRQPHCCCSRILTTLKGVTTRSASALRRRRAPRPEVKSAAVERAPVVGSWSRDLAERGVRRCVTTLSRVQSWRRARSSCSRVFTTPAGCRQHASQELVAPISSSSASIPEVSIPSSPFVYRLVQLLQHIMLVAPNFCIVASSALLELCSSPMSSSACFLRSVNTK